MHHRECLFAGKCRDAREGILVDVDGSRAVEHGNHVVGLLATDPAAVMDIGFEDEVSDDSSADCVAFGTSHVEKWKTP